MLLPEALGQVLVVVVMGDADDETLAVFPDLVRHVCVRNLVRHHDGPLDVADQRVKLVVLVAEGIKAADKASHAGAGDDIHRDAEFFHVFDDAKMRQTARAASGEDESHRGTVLPDGVHPGPDLGERQ